MTYRYSAAFVVALLMAGLIIVGCGGSETKQQECSAMTEKAEHDVCVAELDQERAAERGQAQGAVEPASAEEGEGEEGSTECPFTADQVSTVMESQLEEWLPPLLAESEFVICNFTNNAAEEEGYENQRDLTVYTFPLPEVAAKSPAAMRQELEGEAPGDRYVGEESWGEGAFYDVTEEASIREANIYLPQIYIHVDAYGEAAEEEVEEIAQKLGDMAAGVTEPEAGEEPTEEPGGPLEYVGTIKVDNKAGTTYTDRYKIGPLSSGEDVAVSAEVLQICGTESRSEAAASVFARGEIETTYSEGSLPDMISVGEEETIKSGSDEGELGGALQVASFLGGEWHCLGEPVSYEIQPGETMDIPIWFIGDLVLSNERPRLSKEEIDSLYFTPVGGLALAGTTPGYWHVSGPGAAKCPEYGYKEPRLLVYGRSGTC